MVSVTRLGFDSLHHRVLTYSFDSGADGSALRDALICIQTSDVLLENVNGTRLVHSYSGLLL